MLQLEPSEEHYYIDYLRFLIRQAKYTEGLKVIKKSEENVYSPDLLYLKIICLLGVNKKSRAMALLDIVLEENFDKHTVLSELMPEIVQDESIQSIIRYYKK